MDSTLDYYALLGIGRNATTAEIKRAYRKMVFQYHPDRNPGDNGAAEKLKQVLEAYGTLSDSSKRVLYDEATRPATAEEPAEEQPREEQYGEHVNDGFHYSYEFKSKTEPQPKCPQCSVAGTDYVISRKGGTAAGRGKQFVLSPFNIIFCSQCGHVYGVTGQST